MGKAKNFKGFYHEVLIVCPCCKKDYKSTVDIRVYVIGTLNDFKCIKCNQIFVLRINDEFITEATQKLGDYQRVLV